MNKISELKFDEFIELVEFLKFNDDEEEYHNITKRLTRFIADLNATHSLYLDNIVKDILTGDIESAEKLFEIFKTQFPNLGFDPEGKLDLKEFEYFQISLQTCDLLYEQACDRISREVASHIDYQVKEAKELTSMLNLEGRFEYPIKKMLYLKSNNRALEREDFEKLETQIKQIFKEKENNIMGKFLHFISNKKYEKCHIFIEHFMERVNILSKDKDLKYDENKKYLDLLSQL